MNGASMPQRTWPCMAWRPSTKQGSPSVCGGGGAGSLLALEAPESPAHLAEAQLRRKPGTPAPPTTSTEPA
eukprot:1926468-Pyramimonas_sp.AAC.1